MRVRIILILLPLLILYSAVGGTEELPPQKGLNSSARDDAESKEPVRVISPSENSVIIAKKPKIKVNFTEAVDLKSLMVTIDGTDITQLLSATDKGFEYKPVMVLPAGTHSLIIKVKNSQGKQLQKSVTFTTRQSSTFEEAYTSNEASINYESALAKPEEAASVPYSKIEGNLRSDSKIRNKEWEMSFTANLRYFDQSLPSGGFQSKGFNLANYLLTAGYAGKALKVQSQIGDILINETQNTVFGLSRRGARLFSEYKNFTLNTFAVKGESVFGFRGGTGIDFDADDHILGVSGNYKLLDGKVEFKVVYATGGEPGNSFPVMTAPLAGPSPSVVTTPGTPCPPGTVPATGSPFPDGAMSGPGTPATLQCLPETYSTASEPGRRKGDVVGLVLRTDFLQNKLRTEFETDFTRFDPDTSDEFKTKSDKAYRFKAGGMLGKYSYEVVYEYFGKDFSVIGNQMQQKDKEGVSVRGGAYLGKHNLNLFLSRYNDNVTDDDLFSTTVNYQGNLDYSFNGIPRLPIGIGLQTSHQENSGGPENTTPLEMNTGTVMGRVSYMIDKINLGFQSSYSLMDDRTPSNADTTAVMYSFTPSYITPALSVSPSFSLNQSKTHLTDVRNDIYLINLDVRSKFLRGRASFDVGGSYSISKANDGSSDMRNLNANFRLGYTLTPMLQGLIKPVVALRGNYMNVRDRINHVSDRDEFTLFLVLATAMPFSF